MVIMKFDYIRLYYKKFIYTYQFKKDDRLLKRVEKFESYMNWISLIHSFQSTRKNFRIIVRIIILYKI